MSTTTTATPKRSFMDGKKLWFILSIVFAVVAVVFVLLILRAVTATEPYYVLNTNVSARQAITPADLTEITTSAGSAPDSLTPADVANGSVFAKYDLKIGDVPTSSSAGSLTPLSVGLPSNYVITSFKANPSTAAGGNIERGDYVDLYVVDTSSNNSTNPSHLFLQHVLVLSATADLDSSTSTDSNANTSGSTSSSSSSSSATATTVPDQTSTVPFLFTVGVSQTDAAKLYTADQYTVYVALSSTDAVNGKVSSVNVGASASDIFSGAVGDSGIGTDNTFTGPSTKQSTTQKATAAKQALVRKTAEQITAIVKAYTQLNRTWFVSDLKNSVTNAGYTVPSGVTFDIAQGSTSSTYTITVLSSDKSYGYIYNSATDSFGEQTVTQ